MTLWTITLQAPLSHGFSMQDWSRLPCPPQGIFLTQSTRDSSSSLITVGSSPPAPPRALSPAWDPWEQSSKLNCEERQSMGPGGKPAGAQRWDYAWTTGNNLAAWTHLPAEKAGTHSFPCVLRKKCLMRFVVHMAV